MSKHSLTVRVGSAAPDFEAVDTEGNSVRLSEIWKASPVVVVFLRHLGCTFCRTHVMELRRCYKEIRAKGAEVVCVAMGSPKVGKGFRIVFDVPFPMLMTGEDASVYDLYELPKGSLGALIGISSWLGGLRALPALGAKIVGRVQGDGTQLAGTFIIDQSGTIRVAYRSKNAADNPRNELLLETLGELQEGGSPIEDKRIEHAAA